MNAYFTEFLQAMTRTRSFGLESPFPWFELTNRRLNPATAEGFSAMVEAKLATLPSQKLAGECLGVSLYLQEAVSQWFGCEAIYTLGWLDDGSEEGLFKFDEAYISRMLREKYQGGPQLIHAWLTLPTMEVIDLTYMSTIAEAQHVPEVKGQLLAAHADDFTAHAYKPMLLGTGFLKESGAAM